MPLPFTRTLDLKLIELVKKNPILYDLTHPKHMSFDEREVVWQKIGDALNRPAVEFAGIQCQIHYGDFQEDKHKPGLIENLSEYLPEQYSSSWGIEKKILKEFSKHHGLSQIEAKFLYTKTARDLPTYGVTFFLVKEKQKGKKKLVPRLLGINAESILRLDEVTKEILQVWPLTQVKTYHAGMSETFTLNFGDYSDKEYSVKTNDAHRIRDILQGYIDIIRKRMEANYNLNQTEYHAICEDNVHASRGNIMERIEHKPSKIVEESFVGPSQIFTYEPGKAIAQGTQIVTVQQLVVNANKRNNQQNAMMEEEEFDRLRNLRSEQQEFGRKLIRLNSNSVQIVTLLSEPNQANLSEVTKIVDSMEANMPSIVEAIKIKAEEETNKQTKQKLLDRLQELSDCMKTLSDYIVDGKAKEAQEAGKRVADLSIQMCSAFDPGMVKKKEFCRRSRKSFIEDEHLDATLRRASFLAAAQTASGTIDEVKLNLHKEYQGPPLDAAQVQELEKSAADKMAKLNAAVALNLTAYTDPNNIDYAAAVTSMNSINELLPELAKDAKALSSVNDGKNREELLDAIRALCDSLKAVCSEDALYSHKEMELAAKDYAQKSGKLLFTFRRGSGPNADKEKEILLASQDVEMATKDLVDRSKRLAKNPQHEGMQEVAHNVVTASDQCSIAAKDVHICAQLTASAIHEPHCRSALKAASETLSSSAKHLAFTCKPMLHVDDKEVTNDLKQKFLDLAAALDRLKDTYAGFEEESPDEVKAKRKLKFVTSVAEAKKKMNEAEDELNKPLMELSTQEEATKQELQRRLAQRMAQLNAALAALVAATADRDNQDYETAELAVSTIAELMPDVVRDGKLLSAQSDPATRELMLEDLRALCEATKDICHTTDSGNLDDMNKQASKLAKSAGKLIFMFKPHRKQDNEKQIVGISSSANEKAAQLMAGVEELLQQVGPGTELETANRRLADAARALETATELTAPCIEDPRCQESLISAADAVTAADQNLAAVMMPLMKDPRYKPMGDKLEAQRLLLEQELDRLRKACRDIGAGGAATEGQKRKEAVRLQFRKGGAQIAAAHKLLDKPTVPLKSKVSVEELRRKLADDVNRLNAAVAALVAASADRENPDCEATEEAINTINQLLPQVITDTKTLSSMEDEATRAAMLADLRALCLATEDIFSSPEHPNQDLNKAAVKFGAVSGRLVYVFDPRADQDREHTVLDLSSSACEKASALLSGVYQLATEVGGEPGTELDNAGSKVADGANILLTTAQLTSPCIQDPACRSKLLSSADVLETASQNLASIWKPLVQNPKHSPLGDTLKNYQGQLEKELEKLRKACQIADSELQTKLVSKPVNETQRLQFVTTATAADNNLRLLEKELDEPLPPSQAPVPASLQNKLAQSLAQLNAAIAALLAATSDRENPDYVKAEQAIQQINQIMPHVVKNMRVVGASKDPQTRDLMMSDLRATCEAVRALCSDAHAQGRNEQAAILADKCSKLYYVVSPRVDQIKEHEIIDLTTDVCQKAAMLLSGVHQLASSVQGEAGTHLDVAGAQTADAADTLLATAQLTAASIHEPASRTALLSSTDGVASTVTTLSSTWEPVVKNPVHAAASVQLREHKAQLEAALEKLKAAIMEDRGALKSPTRKAPPPPPKRLTSYTPPAPSVTDVTQHFLDALREDEARAASEVRAAAERKKLEEEKALQQKLRSSVDSAVQHVQKSGELLTKLYSSESEVIPSLSLEQTAVVQKQMEHKLAAANVAAAKLVNAQHLNELDYAAACEPTAALADIIPHIVQDAKLLRGALDEEEKKSFLEDVLAMFDATKVLLGAAKNDHRNINESAVVFGNKTAKLLYVVSTDVDPAQEKEVFVQARGIGDSASRLAVLAAEKGGAGVDQQFAELCSRGGACADAAGTMLYTTKLLAPCIQVSECQQTLTKATDDLSQLVQQYSDTWGAIQTDPHTKQELQKETQKLDQMLKTFKDDVQSGRFVKRRPVERIAVQNTPLRQLTCAILEDAQKRATQSTLPPEQRAAYVKYGAQLGRAIKQMDVAYHHSQKAPYDLDKRLHLENAVQELQVAVLMQRPTSDTPQSNVVDLTDYVRAAKEDAEKLSKGCNDLPELHMVKEHCERIKEYAARTMNPELYEQNPGEGITDDRRDVVQFAEECDKRVRAVDSIIQNLEDGKVKINLRDKTARLAESTNLLNFATKCDLATTQSVSLDATLEELTDLEKKIDDMLAAGSKRLIPNKNASWSQSGRGRLITAASRTGTTAINSLVPAYAAYVDDVRVGGDLSDPAYKKGSKEHLMKVLRLLKTLTMTNSRHVATWQSPNQPETAVITEQIIKELENNEASAVDGTQKSVLNEIDINMLLLPTQSKIQVDPKQLPEKLNQAASKLSCSVGTLVQSANKPTSLARTVPSVYEAAMTLATIARHAPVKDIAHSQKIDEASKEMSIQTYNVLKTAESVSHEPNNYATRRKFLDACNRLNDAISILVRSAVPSDKLHKECAVSLYRAQQQGAGAVAGWCCALGYPHILPALQNQRDVLEKLNEEAPQSREEFSRSVAHVSAAVDSSSQYASHAAYLLSIADQHNELATEGFIDVGRIQNLSEAVQESCHRVMMTEADQAKEEAPILIKQVQDFQQAVTEAQDKVKDEKDKNELREPNNELEEAVKELNAIVHEKTLNKGRLATITIRILESTRWIIYIIERISIIPEIKEVSVEAKARSDDVLKNCRNLNTKMLSLIREVKTSEQQDPMTWATFGTRKAVLEMFEALMSSVQENGKRAGILEPSQTDLDEEQIKRSFVQVQLDLANKWLARPAVKPEIKTAGEQAARTIISLGEKISEDLKGQEKEEIQDLVTSSEELLADCLKKHDPEKAHLLMERLKALRKAIERCVVARIVDDFLEGEEPLADLDILCDAETDEEKRKFLLERKIAELLAHLGRVTKTARVAARAGNGTDGVNEQLVKCSEQTELLAPMLVQAAQKRVVSPDDQAAIEHYQKLLAQYAESLANLRGLCDQAVDPMDFVQTAGETMQRLREDTTNDNDPQKCAYASTAITKLANRVITVSMSSSDVRKDPELQKALKEAKERLKAVVPGPNARPSRIPDWKVTTAEILRTTGEVESVLGGEMIFKKQQTSDEPIFAAAYDLHTAIRSWSAKDNEIVAVAKRMAVLMAKLSDYMHTDRKRDVIVTAKAIVSESREVAELARKLAHECSDVRIKTNLLQICERIPTISGQLKMLATVKGSLGHQGLKEDQEDMNMLVGNAQNLMLSVQEAVNAAASASVKIMSQRGGSRMRWVRKSYY